ncbi:hypothetical protein BJ138DRAFT_784572 [Hygrophoropsis aurantiaca]|uniref:Uncharacterized protein n=1 Tax=Hygrophoropsis aurantiaca TaxID=72124 RepID=A0ACB8AGB3_9AGAM|nr:hypothetical protein BJ138DRAFT_784572 [Hygrophoropsis aurantiaca]
MVLLSDKKYACETCIKGHRSSACKHTDRPLFEIKKKGRPVTQCEHCRELRKTKQVHVKCLCGLQEQGPSTPDPDSGKHATPKVPAVAAFPNGLPEALGALVAPHLHSDGSADSDHSGEQSSAGGCKCNVGGACHCCTPRKPKSRRRSSAQDDKHNSESLTRPVLSHPPPLSSHVLARIAELRPVLPRPSRRDANAVEPLHNPSAGLPHGHGARHHTHDHTLYSPYGRAYEQIHAPEQLYSNRAPILTNETPSFPPPPLNYTADAWPSVEGVAPSACACGDSCRCPGCTLHNNVPIPPGSAYSCCTNPASCTFCLDCTILSMSPNSPNLTDSSTTGQFREFDEWLQQMSASSPTLSHSNSYPLSENLSPMYLNIRRRPVIVVTANVSVPRELAAAHRIAAGAARDANATTTVRKLGLARHLRYQASAELAVHQRKKKLAVQHHPAGLIVFRTL